MSSTADKATTTRDTRGRAPLSAWELGSLLTPMHQYRKGSNDKARHRHHFVPILGYVYRNRYAIANQIQRRFPQYLKSDRTARRHLAEMESLGLLGIAPTRNTSPLWPKVYYVTGRGANKLRRALSARGKPGTVIHVDRHRKDGQSADHVLHEVLTTEFLLHVHETAQTRDDVAILRIERRTLARQRAFKVGVNGKLTRLTPDALFVFRKKTGMMACFVELDTGSMSRAQITAKFERYDAWQRTEKGRQFLRDMYAICGAANPKPSFRILLIAGAGDQTRDLKRVSELWEEAAAFPGLLSRLWITTGSLISQASLQQPTWWWGSDLDGDQKITGERLFGAPRRALW